MRFVWLCRLFCLEEFRALNDFEGHVSAVKKLAELKFRLMFAKSYLKPEVFMEFKQDLIVRQKVLAKAETRMEDAQTYIITPLRPVP